MMKSTLITVMTLVALTANAQEERTLQYYPEDGGFACVNGMNRYTRALYGGYTDYRIETSDRPIFAVYKKKNYRNVRFYVNGVRLDSASYCKAVYKDGTRIYTVKDKAWDDRELHITVLALHDTEGAMWKMSIDGKPVAVDIITGDVKNPKMHRNGDMGVDKADTFEPADNQPNRKTYHFEVGRESYVRLDGSDMMTVGKAADYDKEIAFNNELANRIVFKTPDPYFNTLGSALAFAADGLWDGATKTWLHGCIGWRMPLAGWRAAYVGDVMGWNDRQEQHFQAYANSQVKDIEPKYPHPNQDSSMNLARAEKKWGTQMYSNGYICRNPNNDHQMHHYDMNLNYLDELVRHFRYNDNLAFMRKMLPVLERGIEWENRNYDPDGDHLYDGYACIWASDGLYYNGGAATHSSAYNYFLNRMAFEITNYLQAEGYEYFIRHQDIRNAMRRKLRDRDGSWAEYRDAMGLKRLHPSAALWSYYTPIDCELENKGAFNFPEIEMKWNTAHYDSLGIKVPEKARGQSGESLRYLQVATSNWMPYCWSIHNVAPAETMHAALALFKDRKEYYAQELVRGTIMDEMYLGHSPANFGQLSYYDAARGECYRDFGDVIGITSRTLVEGLFGIRPDMLNGKCVIEPGFVNVWDTVSVKTPYLSYRYWEHDDEDSDKKGFYIEVEQNFGKPVDIEFRVNCFSTLVKAKGTNAKKQTLFCKYEDEKVYAYSGTDYWRKEWDLGLDEPVKGKKFRTVDLKKQMNANVSDIFENQYLEPRPQTTTLQIPVQGVGEWCHPKMKPEINDAVFRSKIRKGQFTAAGVPFATPAKGQNIIYTSLWNNYPDSVEIPLAGQAENAYLLLAGSTNYMQSRIDNGIIEVEYEDGSVDELHLKNPENWCPIEQDYYVDDQTFSLWTERPYRVCFGTGDVSRDLGKTLGIEGVYGREIKGGAGEMLRMKLDKSKTLRKLTLRTLSNDVVIGLMAITLQ